MAQNRFSRGEGPSQRQLRVGELIRRTLSDVLLRGDVHDPDLNRIPVTVGEVRCSPDLKVATVFVSALGGQGQDELIGALARHAGELRHLVAREMTLKYAPELRFRPDETYDRLDETRRMFADAKVQADIARRDADGEGADDDDVET
ncbi:30S ribosome-binding factor RbfA [Phaeovulum vinaykumarii]|uniref:Ribosome-binding factor A n=1 Tax=Phaeovulum vinaykumarii TaxID=407234 RepID=A0A1N7KZ63_9RHOB|nr:30S ribosome-binding factor RbfA [Phaeovulum vinaykumarii]SIS66899.1 ribosome-binding factor A [Phaeovulum vinaykumarii]SOC00923.1 ribosome-binding factor A [Phaeovulum vinaykumarii]